MDDLIAATSIGGMPASSKDAKDAVTKTEVKVADSSQLALLHLYSPVKFNTVTSSASIYQLVLS